MTPHLIELSSGEAAYLPGYAAAARERFPHHGGILLQGERDLVPAVSGRLHYSSVRDFVCPQCDKACREWWAKHPGEKSREDGRLR
jgi:hypothetical protein